MLINLSNHPSKGWSETQLQVATEQYGGVQDFSFPNVPPHISEKEIKALAKALKEELLAIRKETGDKKRFAVHLMGEMTLTFRLVKLLKRANIPVLASTTERHTTEQEDGTKVTRFQFVRFREYV